MKLNCAIGGRMFSRSRLARAVVGLSLVSLSAVPLRAQNPTQPLDQTALQRDPLRPAPNRAAGEGLGP